MIQIDDFNTHGETLAGLENLVDMLDGASNTSAIALFALLGQSDVLALYRLGTWDRVQIVGVHGWNHFCETSFGYWEMRHLLETAISWDCFNRMFTMPWNRMPSPGALRALKEKDFTLVTPYRWQRLVATLAGCNAVDLHADILTHPPDLLTDEGLEYIVETVTGRDIP